MSNENASKPRSSLTLARCSCGQEFQQTLAHNPAARAIGNIGAAGGLVASGLVCRECFVSGTGWQLYNPRSLAPLPESGRRARSKTLKKDNLVAPKPARSSSSHQAKARLERRARQGARALSVLASAPTDNQGRIPQSRWLITRELNVSPYVASRIIDYLVEQGQAEIITGRLRLANDDTDQKEGPGATEVSTEPEPLILPKPVSLPGSRQASLERRIRQGAEALRVLASAPTDGQGLIPRSRRLIAKELSVPMSVAGEIIDYLVEQGRVEVVVGRVVRLVNNDDVVSQPEPLPPMTQPTTSSSAVLSSLPKGSSNGQVSESLIEQARQALIKDMLLFGNPIGDPAVCIELHFQLPDGQGEQIVRRLERDGYLEATGVDGCYNVHERPISRRR